MTPSFKNKIAIFACGKSALDLSLDEYMLVCDHCDTVAINMFPRRANYRITSDIGADAFVKPTEMSIAPVGRDYVPDYTFDLKTIDCNFTSYTAIQFVRANAPKAEIYLFGYDFADPKNYLHDGDDHEKYGFYLDECLAAMRRRFEREPELFGNVWNMSANSKMDFIKRGQFYQITGA